MKYNRNNIKGWLVSTSFKIYLDILSYMYITFTIFYYNTISLSSILLNQPPMDKWWIKSLCTYIMKMRSVMCISYCFHDWQTIFIILFSSFWNVDREKGWLVSTSFKIYLDILSYMYITFTIFYYNTISLKCTFFSCSS
jgi:hypothetical protein